jgi:hypothetical protein
MIGYCSGGFVVVTMGRSDSSEAKRKFALMAIARYESALGAVILALTPLITATARDNAQGTEQTTLSFDV